MKVAEVVVRILEDEGIQVAFGIPGAAINPVYGFLLNSKIKHYIARHEEGAVHAADGYYRVSGKLAVAICTSGPAATNFVTGLYTAQADSVPLIAITGNANVSSFGKGAFQCVDIATIAKTVAKATWCITNPADVPKIMREAFRTACSGRPGPVLIDLPLDVQMAEIEYDPAQDSPLPWTRPAPEPKAINQAMDLIMAAKAPLMILGGGVILSDATAEFRELAEYLQIPVIMTYMGKGGLPYEHPLNAGHAGIQVGQPIGNKTFLESDLVIGVGCRFTDRHTGKLDVYKGERKFIHIDIEPHQINLVLKADVGIVSDAKSALVALLEEAKKRGYRPEASERVKKLPETRAQLHRPMELDEVPIRPHRVFQELNKFFPPNTIFTAGCGITQIWSGQLQDIELPRRYIPSGGAGTLGYELPAAIGAKVACPNDPCVVVVGDAGLLFMVEELAMAGQHDLPIIVVVVNNGFLGLIRQNQKYAYGYEHGVSLWYAKDGDKDQIYPDNVKIAEAFGGKGERVFEPGNLAAAFERAIKSNVPYLIDVIVAREADCSMGGAINAVREFV
ncbi:MAG TPA: thiamine pyrophosphate-dependent enzyme [Terracidiphilus sp.]|jgi:tartronate-semialdehyde synthase|nr:thiamine pyrophosphate-dependent enzyme [Terracidiphilus sp.]